MLRIDLTAMHGKRKFRYRFESESPRIVLTGPSGSGKTTLLRALVGVHPAVGEFQVGGNILIDTAQNICVAPNARRVGWVPQTHLLFPHLNVLQNLVFGGSEDLERVVETLKLEPLLNRPPRNLSGGEKQRVSIARALLCRPKLLLLDEPFASLNSELRSDAIELINAYCREHHAAVILSSHSEHNVETFQAQSWKLEAS